MSITEIHGCVGKQSINSIRNISIPVI